MIAGTQGKYHAALDNYAILRIMRTGKTNDVGRYFNALSLLGLGIIQGYVYTRRMELKWIFHEAYTYRNE
jgi:hypothetical protein